MQREEAEEARSSGPRAPSWRRSMVPRVRLEYPSSLNKMVREAQLAQYNYILVVGADEEKNGTASVRTRDNAQHGSKPVDELIAEFARMTADHVLDLQLGVDAAEGQEGK